jgi:hypothetical protein
MTSCMIDVSDKPRLSKTDIVNIAVEFLSDGRPMSECRGHLLSEYEVNADDLGRPLEEALRQVRASEVEFGSRLVF